MNFEKVATLKKEIADYEREAWDERAWGHHRAYAARRAADLRQELSNLEASLPSPERPPQSK